MSGFLLVLSGPSGVGKGTIIKEVLDRGELPCKLSVSATTRAPRVGEEDGVHYSFVTRKQFERMIDANELLEYAQYADNYYGTPRSQLDDNLCVILDIEVRGMFQVRGRTPCVTVFIEPPDWVELEHRLRGRGTEGDAVIAKRLSIAREEYAQLREYDYAITNNDVNQAAADLSAIIRAEFLKTERKQSL
ncbi:guanylate kinase [Clostridia bacterium]|nr:guanylate kinase [Clostridia bacterium]